MKRILQVIIVLAFLGWSQKIQAQTFHVDSLSATCLSPGDSVMVYYTILGSFNVGNVFTAQLSSNTCSFAAPIVIGTINTYFSAYVHCYIPTNTPLGNYCLRVLSSNPYYISDDTIANINITGQLNMAITPSGPLVNCAANFLSLDAGAFANYNWNTGETTQSIMVFTSGNYSVTVSNGGSCIGTDTVTAIFAMSPTPVITANGPTTFSIGDSVALDAGSYISYIWNTGATTESIYVFNSGTYTVTVIDANGCTGTASQAIVVTPCSAHFAIYPDSILHHYLITNNAVGQAPITYFWTWGDGQHDSIAYPSHTYQDTGYYTICLTIADANACSSVYCDSGYHVARTANTMAWVTVHSPTTVVKEILVDENRVEIYPNPAHEVLNIHQTKPSENQQLLITDVLGNRIYSQSLNEADTRISLKKWSRGVYIYEVRDGNQSQKGRFVIE